MLAPAAGEVGCRLILGAMEGNEMVGGALGSPDTVCPPIVGSVGARDDAGGSEEEANTPG